VNRLCFVAADHDPGKFMHLVPAELQLQLKETSRIVPASIDQLGFWESSVYKASAFEGLSEAEIDAKIEQERRARKERLLRGLAALNRFFAAREQ
jgi:hypothetical protein